ncbi:nickel pincer cofactor biosynthesis protein LarB [Arsenicicoccus piscis]|uniref:1-(5-phosphoribosyl)-5-amino-4-imidazole-carboxyl ate carboxylase n=1 Tax=Arsenicicoccus piscis TaxID=673954 RepID=A0ABQ6HM23_9MICO|nr:1-(5-phosphoribosyl)-5-amino-4-imidazole-carboxyl ate carboxylase [Arsenicicoccus piscis]
MAEPDQPGSTPADVELDLGRAARRGYPEAIYCEGKSVDQVRDIARRIKAFHAGAGAGESVAARSDMGASAGGEFGTQTTLFTRADAERAAAVLEVLPDAVHDPSARLLAWPPAVPTPSGGLVVVAAAGTSDLPVARKAELTARYRGRRTELVMDVGVAGLHRVLGRLDLLRRAAAVVVVAGMDGTLPSVVAGLVSAPVVACPTSVGYGAAFDGLAPLLAMLNACSPAWGSSTSTTVTAQAISRRRSPPPLPRSRPDHPCRSD